MPKVINLAENASEIEDVVQIPTQESQSGSLKGPWDNESLEMSERVELLSKEVERLENESITKRYVVEGGIDVGDEIKKFIKDRVKWRFTDAFLVVNAYNEVDQAVKECRKTQVFELTGIFIEPLLQMLQSAEGIGLESAKTFYEKLLVPISETVNVYRKDTQLLQNLKLRLGALENGINPDAEESSESEN